MVAEEEEEAAKVALPRAGSLRVEEKSGAVSQSTRKEVTASPPLLRGGVQATLRALALMARSVTLMGALGRVRGCSALGREAAAGP